jgi:hypothetical protein
MLLPSVVIESDCVIRCRVLTLQTLPGIDEPPGTGVGNVAGFFLHAGVTAKAKERHKLERLCRYISRPAVSESCTDTKLAL